MSAIDIALLAFYALLIVVFVVLFVDKHREMSFRSRELTTKWASRDAERETRG